MGKQIKIRGLRRKQVDEDKLALAYLLLAKILHESERDEAPGDVGAVRADAEKGA